MASERDKANRWRPRKPTILRMLHVVVATGGCAKSPPDPIQRDIYVFGIREPDTVAAEDARITDEQTVIGVSVGEVHRAYVVEAFSLPPGYVVDETDEASLRKVGRHIVNDIVGGMAISIAHCDDTSCTRVFTDGQGDSMDLSIGGWRDGQMQILLLGKRYAHDSDDIPLKEHPFSVTTWRAWKKKHPQTDLYVGKSSP